LEPESKRSRTPKEKFSKKSNKIIPEKTVLYEIFLQIHKASPPSKTVLGPGTCKSHDV